MNRVTYSVHPTCHHGIVLVFFFFLICGLLDCLHHFHFCLFIIALSIYNACTHICICKYVHFCCVWYEWNKTLFLSQVTPVSDFNLVAVQLTHENTNTQHLHIAREDSNNVFWSVHAVLASVQYVMCINEKFQGMWFQIVGMHSKSIFV